MTFNLCHRKKAPVRVATSLVVAFLAGTPSRVLAEDTLAPNLESLVRAPNAPEPQVPPAAEPTTAPVPSPVPAPAPSPAPAPLENKTPEKSASAAASETPPGGFYFAWLPFYHPKIGGDDGLNSGVKSAFEAGLSGEGFSDLYVIRYASGTIPTLTAVSKSLGSAVVGKNITHRLGEFHYQPHIRLNAPNGTFGPVQFFIPLSFGLSLSQFAIGEDNYLGAGLVLGTGGGAAVHIGSHFILHVTGIYQLGIAPLKAFSTGRGENTLYNSVGNEASITVTTFLLRLGISIGL